MSLGTGALRVGREPENLKHSEEVSMATLWAGTTQNSQLSKVLGESGTHGLHCNSPLDLHFIIFHITFSLVH